MSLLDDIIEAAVDTNAPIGTLLRKCLVLAHQVKNEKFKAWLDRELDGYPADEELPEYREYPCVNRGFFVGSFGRQVNNQPLSLLVMEKEHRKIVETLKFSQPAVAYDERPKDGDNFQIPWPPALTAKYQSSFFQDKSLALNRAWQEIPGSVLVALVEQVRTRVLRFALELQDNLPAGTSDPKQVPSAAVEQSVVNNIFGGNILIAAKAENVSQLSHTHIAVGDTTALTVALKSLGITDDAIKQLESDMTSEKEAIGPKVKKWMANVGSYLGKEGAKAGIDVVKKFATRWILQKYGIDLD